MNFTNYFQQQPKFLMEGAIIERLKREFLIPLDKDIDMAGIIYDEKGKKALKIIYQQYLDIAEKYKLPFLATTSTRRANQERVGNSKFEETVIKDQIKFMMELKKQAQTPVFIGGLMGSKGNSYEIKDVLSVKEAIIFHSWQANLFQESKADFMMAGIMPALSEAMGIAIAMDHTKLPYIISFMVKKDGKLLDGTTIHEAIYQIDQATQNKPLCYITNCVHPTILKQALSQSFNQTVLVKERFLGIQANASALSLEELDYCCDLHTSDHLSLAIDMKALEQVMSLKILGGCCGTNQEHLEEIAKILFMDS